METYFRYSPEQYEIIWSTALTRGLAETTEAVKQIYEADHSTLTNGATPEFVAKQIWESAEEYRRLPTHDEVDALADWIRNWQFYSDLRGFHSGTIRKLIELFRKTNAKALTQNEKEALIGGGFCLTERCDCGNDALRKIVQVTVECPTDVTSIDNLKDYIVLATDWEGAKRFCPKCQ